MTRNSSTRRLCVSGVESLQVVNNHSPKPAFSARSKLSLQQYCFDFLNKSRSWWLEAMAQTTMGSVFAERQCKLHGVVCCSLHVRLLEEEKFS